MAATVEDGLNALERIIAKAEVRRVDTMIHIAFLEADDLNSIEAHADLATIEKLLKTMRKQRLLLAASVHHHEADQHDAGLLQVAA
ncbi:hypothetical protein ACLBWX_22435 [Methylobacterium sp. M6A4_1b]